MLGRLSAADAVALHNAIHAKPLPATVTTSYGDLPMEANKYGNGSVLVSTGAFACRVVGANPEKDSKYGRKMQTGGAVSLINPNGSKGWEGRCIVIESREPGSPASESDASSTD